MEQIGKRIKIFKTTSGEATIQIASPKNLFLLIFLPIWLLAWTAGGVFAVLQAILGTGKGNLFLFIWFCGWLAAEIFISAIFLWGAFGKEIVSLLEGRLIIKRSVFNYGRIRAFEIPKVCCLRSSGFFGSMLSWNLGMAYWGLSGGTVAFDYRHKTERFGINLSEKDATALVAYLKTRFHLP